VLDLSKIESNFIELKIERFDLNEMVREVVANVQPMVAENGNKLAVKCPNDLGIVLTDQTKLRQAALNLMSNAAKFTQEGSITLSVQRRKSQAGDWIEIQVQDSGIGIAQSDMGRLFQNFGQAKPWYVHQIRWNRSRLGVEPEIVRAHGRWHLRDQRAWPWIVLFDPRARLDE